MAAGHRVRGADRVRSAARRRHRVQLVSGDPAGLVRVRVRAGAGPDRERPGVAGHRAISRPGAGVRRIGHRRAVRRGDRDRHPLPAVPRGLRQGPGGQRRQQYNDPAADQAQGRAAGGRADRAEGTQLPCRSGEVPRAGAHGIRPRLRDRVPRRQRGRPDRARRHGDHGPAAGGDVRRSRVMRAACSPRPPRWSASGTSATPADKG
jgi:hypothetical protein